MTRRSAEVDARRRGQSAPSWPGCAAFEGRQIGPPEPAPMPVNRPMIRHWCEAMGDTNPVYTDRGGGRASVHGGSSRRRPCCRPGSCGASSPATGRRRRRSRTSLLRCSTSAGFHLGGGHQLRPGVRRATCGPATSCRRPSVIESVSEEKQTGLGVGHFVTTRIDYTDQAGEVVGDHAFPHPQVQARDGPGRTRGGRPAARPKRPRPALTQDNAWWFEAAREHKLLIQRCAICGALRHPPEPMCGRCQSFDWDTVEASGRGTVYSFVVNHHPQVPAFDYPLVVGLIELEEGTRLVANVDRCRAAERWSVGMPVEVEFVDHDDELTLPAFRPARLDERRPMDFTLSEEQQAVRDLAAQIFEGQATTERVKEVEAGDERVDRELWAELAEANLLGIALPEDVGGSGFGLVELCLLLEQQGRRVAPVPLLADAGHGRAADRRVRFGRAAGRVAAGRRRRARSSSPPAWPRPAPAIRRPTVGDGPVRRRQPGGGWTAPGSACPPPTWPTGCWCRPAADDGVGVWLVDPRGPGVSLRAGRDDQPRDRRPSRSSTARPASALGPARRRGRDRALDPRPGHRGRRRPAGGGVRGGAGPGGRIHVDPAPVRPAAVDLPGRRAQGGRRLHRHRGHPGHHVAGGVAAGIGLRRRRPRSRWPSGGPPTPASGSCTPPSTCTAASALTSTTRSTATSCGASSSRTPSAGPRTSWPGWAATWPAPRRRP